MKPSTMIFMAIVIAGCYGKKQEIKKTGLEGQLIPSIDLLAVDSLTHINTASIAPGKPTILFAFEPWCPYCKAQTSSMLSQMEKLKDFNIYMICTSRFSEFKVFNKKYELQKYPNIKVGIDYKNSFSDYFEQTAVPYLAIYGTDRKLKQVMKGKNYISAIKEAALN